MTSAACRTQLTGWERHYGTLSDLHIFLLFWYPYAVP